LRTTEYNYCSLTPNPLPIDLPSFLPSLPSPLLLHLSRLFSPCRSAYTDSPSLLSLLSHAPTSSDLNRLVLDYLIVEGYQTAAEEFVRESGVLDASASKDAGGDDSMDVGEAGGKKSSSDLEGIQVSILFSSQQKSLQPAAAFCPFLPSTSLSPFASIFRFPFSEPYEISVC